LSLLANLIQKAARRQPLQHLCQFHRVFHTNHLQATIGNLSFQIGRHQCLDFDRGNGAAQVTIADDVMIRPAVEAFWSCCV
jgi:hypothetical protein